VLLPCILFETKHPQAPCAALHSVYVLHQPSRSSKPFPNQRHSFLCSSPQQLPSTRGTPGDHLLKSVSKDSIVAFLVAVGLLKATVIFSPKVTAQYHLIYMIAPPTNDKSCYADLVLRVLSHHLPKIKNGNETGVMSWISKNTTIPILDVIAYCTILQCLGE
jgi:hypothetical protein